MRYGLIVMCVMLWSMTYWGTGCGTTPPSKETKTENTPQEKVDTQDSGTPESKGSTEQTAKDIGVKEDKPNEQLLTDDVQTGPIRLSDLKKGQWNMIRPPKGSGAICSRGSEYAFFVYPGTVDKVVFDFQGGGACWDAKSCSFADALFKDSIDDLKKLLKTGYNKGIYDRSNPKNPFKDWHHVYVPYCTGDIHWGDNVKTYTSSNGKEIKINHKGAVNARVVLDWAYKNILKPKKVFVTGCSAGSYGSLIWSAYIAQQYKDSKVYQFGDSGAGVITKNFLKNSFPAWNAEQAAPKWIDGLDPSKFTITDHDLPYMYNKIAAHYKNHVFSQYNTAFDKTQVLFFRAMGGGKNPEEWSTNMRASIQKIVDASTNFRSYIAAGDKHCIIPYPEVYKYEVNGVKLIDWISDMINDKDVKTLSCKDKDCNP